MCERKSLSTEGESFSYVPVVYFRVRTHDSEVGFDRLFILGLVNRTVVWEARSALRSRVVFMKQKEERGVKRRFERSHF